jgi:hypothetical protein
MAHIKTPQINWLDAAWKISAVLARMSSHPTNALAAKLWPDAEKYKGQPVGEDVIDAIEILLIGITLRLAYRLQVHHKAHKKLDGRPIDLDNRDPRVTLKAIKRIESGGVILDNSDFSAFDAHIKLSRILMDRFVCVEWKQTLPLIVASIGGETTTRTATLKAIQPRPRKPNYLKAQKLRALELHPNYSWKQLLKKLKTLNIVTSDDDAFVFWIDEEGRNKSTALATFQKWKPD